VSRRLLAAAALAVALTPLAADAQGIISVRNPVNGCTYSVWGPTIRPHQTPPEPFGFDIDGGFGESASCP
jgi:hypothetical protein